MKAVSPLFWFLLFLSACATANRDIPTVEDQKVRFFVEDEGWRIVKITEKATDYQHYRFYLARFQRPGVVGLSAGNGEIYINYDLAQRAMTDTGYLWVLRKTLAHEVGHDVAGHVPNTQVMAGIFTMGGGVGQILSSAPGVVGLVGSAVSIASSLVGYASVELYTRANELEADRKGIEYFKRLGWDCRAWVLIFESMLAEGQTGDFHHPTEERLNQAKELCTQGDIPRSDPVQPNYGVNIEPLLWEGGSPQPLCSRSEMREKYPTLCKN